MLDIRDIRENPDKYRAGLAARQLDPAIVDRFLEQDERRRKGITAVEALKAQLNKVSKEIGQLKAAKKDAEATALQADMKEVSRRITEMQEEVKATDAALEHDLLITPNLPHSTVPAGKSSDDNRVISEWGKKPEFGFTPLPHWDLGEKLGIIDFERGVKLSGARFYVLRGVGARLDRALINFFLDVNTNESGYTEIFTPQLVKRDTMVGTGQLPKFEDDMYHVESEDLFLISTAEVTLTNLHREEILEATDLPKHYAGYTACYRRESGAAGKDTRGITRVHQFNKVELVKICTPESSYDELEKMRANSELLLRKLNLHYRVVELCTGDLGFASAKTYDLEVWMPGQSRYVEVSSVSNCEDFQARRANLRYRPAPGEKPRFVHTLNGSGLPTGRVMAAVLENNQRSGGIVGVPEALVPYLGGTTIP